MIVSIYEIVNNGWNVLYLFVKELLLHRGAKHNHQGIMDKMETKVLRSIKVHPLQGPKYTYKLVTDILMLYVNIVDLRYPTLQPTLEINFLLCGYRECWIWRKLMKTSKGVCSQSLRRKWLCCRRKFLWIQ